MFKTIKRIIDWCGNFKGRLYVGFIFSFFSTWFAAMPIMCAAYTINNLMECKKNGVPFNANLIWISLVAIIAFILLRFLFDYLRAMFQEAISYDLVTRDRLAIGDALKRVSLGYFQKMNTGNILNSITTGLHTLESMGIRMIDNFVGGYLNYLCVFIFLAVFNWKVSLISVAGVAVSFLFLLLISHYSKKNAPVAAKASRDLTNATLEYARGLSVVKSFSQGGASMQAMKDSCKDSKDINIKIELAFTPLKCTSSVCTKSCFNSHCFSNSIFVPFWTDFVHVLFNVRFLFIYSFCRNRTYK